MTTVSRAVVLGTYRRALRLAASLPSADARAYYAANTRQQFAGHADEVDAARIGHLLRRAEEGIVFVRNKVRAHCSSTCVCCLFAYACLALALLL